MSTFFLETSDLIRVFRLKGLTDKKIAAAIVLYKLGLAEECDAYCYRKYGEKPTADQYKESMLEYFHTRFHNPDAESVALDRINLKALKHEFEQINEPLLAAVLVAEFAAVLTRDPYSYTAPLEQWGDSLEDASLNKAIEDEKDALFEQSSDILLATQNVGEKAYVMNQMADEALCIMETDPSKLHQKYRHELESGQTETLSVCFGLAQPEEIFQHPSDMKDREGKFSQVETMSEAHSTRRFYVETAGQLKKYLARGSTRFAGPIEEFKEVYGQHGTQHKGYLLFTASTMENDADWEGEITEHVCGVTAPISIVRVKRALGSKSVGRRWYFHKNNRANTLNALRRMAGMECKTQTSEPEGRCVATQQSEQPSGPPEADPVLGLPAGSGQDDPGDSDDDQSDDGSCASSLSLSSASASRARAPKYKKARSTTMGSTTSLAGDSKCTRWGGRRVAEIVSGHLNARKTADAYNITDEQWAVYNNWKARSSPKTKPTRLLNQELSGKRSHRSKEVADIAFRVARKHVFEDSEIRRACATLMVAELSGLSYDHERDAIY